MSDHTYPHVRQMVHSLAEAAPEPLPFEALVAREPKPPRGMRGWNWAAAVAAVALVVVGIPLVILRPADDVAPALPRVVAGIRITNLDFGDLQRNFGSFALSPDGDRAVVIREGSWCIAELPPLSDVDDVLPLSTAELSSGSLQEQCIDPPNSVESIAAPRWSPDGSRILIYGQEQLFPPPTVGTAALYVLSSSNLEVEAIILDPGDPPIWVSNSEILYYKFSPQDEAAWRVVSVDGTVLDTFTAPRPSQSPLVQMDDSTIVYVANVVEPPIDPDALDPDVIYRDAGLIKVDLDSGTFSELAPLPDLNPGGFFPDAGYLTGVTSDFRYAVLFARFAASETGHGPDAFVYDLDRQTLIPHALPEFGPQSRTFLPFLVGDSSIIYSPIPLETNIGPDFHLTINAAPLNDPGAAIELFRDGQLLTVESGRLIVEGPEGLVILELGF